MMDPDYFAVHDLLFFLISAPGERSGRTTLHGCDDPVARCTADLDPRFHPGIEDGG